MSNVIVFYTIGSCGVDSVPSVFQSSEPDDLLTG